MCRRQEGNSRCRYSRRGCWHVWVWRRYFFEWEKQVIRRRNFENQRNKRFIYILSLFSASGKFAKWGKNLVDSIKSISKRIKDGRELQYKQEFGLQKFKTMGGEKWRDSKYVYVMSSLQTSLFQLKEFTANSHFVINEMGKMVSAMHPSCMSLYPKISKIDLSFQTNILSLLLKTVLYVKSKDIAFEKIRTSTDKRVWLRHQ